MPFVKLIAVKLQHHTKIMRPTAIFHLKNIAREIWLNACFTNYIAIYWLKLQTIIISNKNGDVRINLEITPYFQETIIEQQWTLKQAELVKHMNVV